MSFFYTHYTKSDKSRGSQTMINDTIVLRFGEIIHTLSDEQFMIIYHCDCNARSLQRTVKSLCCTMPCFFNKAINLDTNLSRNSHIIEMFIAVCGTLCRVTKALDPRSRAIYGVRFPQCWLCVKNWASFEATSLATQQ